MLPNGTTLQAGKFTIQRLLGQGGFGFTYLARQADLDREVVIKAFPESEPPVTEPADRSQFEGAGSRFEAPGPARPANKQEAFPLIREAQLLSRVRHPHLVAVYDIFEEGGSHFIVMEYVAGSTLRELIDRQLPWQQYVHWLLEVSLAVEAMHEKQILHRDLKPANVLVRQAEREAVLIDLGIALSFEEGEKSTFYAAGTPHYQAPEQRDPKGSRTPALDVYGLGATLYHCLIGQPPPTPSQRLNEEVPLPVIPESLPDELLAVVNQAMALRKADRFANVKAFSHALEAVIANYPAEPAASPHINWWQRWGKSAAVALLMFALCFAAYWGWIFWG